MYKSNNIEAREMMMPNIIKKFDLSLIFFSLGELSEVDKLSSLSLLRRLENGLITRNFLANIYEFSVLNNSLW